MTRSIRFRMAVLSSVAVLAMSACDNSGEQVDAQEAGQRAIEAETAAAPAAGAEGGDAQTNPPGASTPVQVQMGSGTVELLPSSGPVGEEVRITGTGLPPGTGGSILGGPDPAQLQPLGDANVDGSGALRSIIMVPETAEDAGQFHFAVKLGDTVSPPLVYRLDSREPAPAN